jgi:hypothetical protein
MCSSSNAQQKVVDLDRSWGEGNKPFEKMKNVMRTSVLWRQYLTRAAASETIKSFGNEAYQAGDYITACRKYTKVTHDDVTMMISLFGLFGL